MTPDTFAAIRDASGKTQKELAAWLGVHWRTVQKWEGAERKIPGPVSKLMIQLQDEHKTIAERQEGKREKGKRQSLGTRKSPGARRE